MGALQTTSGRDAPTFASGRRERHDVSAILLGTCTLLATLALWSYDARSDSNLIGPIGTGLASILVGAFGWVSWMIPFEIAAVTVRLARARVAPFTFTDAVSTLVLLLSFCTFLHLLFGQNNAVVAFGGHLAGGAFGEVLGEVLRAIAGHTGAYLVTVAVLLIMMVLRTRLSVIAFSFWLVHNGRTTAMNSLAALQNVKTAWLEARELDRLERIAADLRDAPKIVDGSARPRPKRTMTAPEELPSDVYDVGDGELFAEEDRTEADVILAPEKVKKPRKAKAPVAQAASLDDAPEENDEPEAKKGSATPKIVDVAKAKPERENKVQAPEVNRSRFQLPPTSLLAECESQQIRIDPNVLRENARQLTETLDSYGVKGRVDEIHPGPVVTMYEFEPRAGTKISKIAALEGDLALALAAQKVRIVAPIPGKARVGIELPNEDRQTVYLREILDDPAWADQRGPLPMALGKDIAGDPVYADLSKMPHLLVAGATGAGKSVGINVMLASLLFKRTPEDVRMLMIDPKVVELAVFDGIPHMLLPVVTDMQKAALALKWAVDEMERRYQLFADAGARSIDTYNRRVEKVIAGELSPQKMMPSKARQVRGHDEEGNEVWADANGEDVSEEQLRQSIQKLPYIVVVVDEFADLMMVAAKDVEACIARLAQKARAAGIHVILATQRPSVDVITGMIKANFPSRMAFKVSQREDSKTILGRIGAQNLLGKGDMLLLPPGTSDLRRVHCAYISEDEVADLCDALRAQGKPEYDESILKPRDEEPGEGQSATSDDPLYDRAVAIVAQAGYCSISHIQRQLSLGYNKAALLVEQMEKEGVVGPPSRKAGGRREVLVSTL